jgi:NAD(P)-dependent dehydrogenase (short-subunit alcohol dehydrogenase family)
MDDDALLSGKAVAVTGAGAGLGRGYARYLASHGADVVVNDVDGQRVDAVVEQITAAGGSGTAHVGSVAKVEDAQGLVETCVERFGRMDALVNNAGIYYHTAPWEDRPENYVPVIEINVLGTMHCGIAFMNHLRHAEQGGSIVNIVSGAQCGLKEQAVYSASKGAVASLTYSWAADLQGTGIRVNAVSPIGRSGTEDPSAPSEPRDDEDPILLARRNASKDPILVAPIVAYLVSDSSQDVTGQVFRMNPPELSVMAHPGFFTESVRVGDWDAASIQRVVDDELRQWFLPVGGVLGITGESGQLLAPSQTLRG